MKPITELIITVSLNILDRASQMPPDSAFAAGLVKLAGILINYAISRDPGPGIAEEAAQLTARLKAKDDALATAVAEQH